MQSHGYEGQCQSAKEKSQFPTFFALTVCLRRTVPVDSFNLSAAQETPCIFSKPNVNYRPYFYVIRSR